MTSKVMARESEYNAVFSLTDGRNIRCRLAMGEGALGFIPYDLEYVVMIRESLERRSPASKSETKCRAEGSRVR